MRLDVTVFGIFLQQNMDKYYLKKTESFIGKFFVKLQALDGDFMSLELKVMVSLHNLGIVKEEVAKTPDQLANTLNMNFDDVKRALETLSSESYVDKISHENSHAYFLTGKGIVTVCSMFT